jgi:hypothetical protein
LHSRNLINLHNINLSTETCLIYYLMILMYLSALIDYCLYYIIIWLIWVKYTILEITKFISFHDVKCCKKKNIPTLTAVCQYINVFITFALFGVQKHKILLPFSVHTYSHIIPIVGAQFLNIYFIIEYRSFQGRRNNGGSGGKPSRLHVLFIFTFCSQYLNIIL